MINNIITTTLSSLNVPVSFQKYSGDAVDTYITFFCYTEKGAIFSDDKISAMEFYVQVDIWSIVDYSEITESVKAAMLNAGFLYQSGTDLYDPDIREYHKALRFYYLQED